MEGKYTVDEALTIVGVGRFHRNLLLVLGIVVLSQSVQFESIAMLNYAILCEFKMQQNKSPSLQIAINLGAIIGAVMQVFLGDKIGRKNMVMLSLSVLAYLDTLVALSPTYSWVVSLFSLIGVFTCATGTFYAIEFFPTVARADATIIRMYWCLGKVLIIILTQYSNEMWTWRTSMLLSSLFPFCACLLLALVPESPRHLLTTRSFSEANKVLQYMARCNSIYLPRHCLKIKMYRTCTRGGIFKTLYKTYCSITSLFCYLVGAMAVLYNGIAILTRSSVETHYKDPWKIANSSCSACALMGRKDYPWLTVLSITDLFGIIASYCVMKLLGRKRGCIVMESTFMLSLVSLLLLDAKCHLILILITNFGLSGALSCLVQYITELYPTCLRGTAVGIIAVFFFAGNALSSYLSSAIAEMDPLVAVLLYLAICWMCLVLTTSLDKETQYHDLEDDVNTNTASKYRI